jgi:hypothetical protein
MSRLSIYLFPTTSVFEINCDILSCKSLKQFSLRQDYHGVARFQVTNQEVYWNLILNCLLEFHVYFLYRQSKKLLNLSEHLCSLPIVGEVRVAHRFNLPYCGFHFVCLHSVSCVHNFAYVSGLFLLFSFGFL